MDNQIKTGLCVIRIKRKSLKIYYLDLWPLRPALSTQNEKAIIPSAQVHYSIMKVSPLNRRSFKNEIWQNLVATKLDRNFVQRRMRVEWFADGSEVFSNDK